MESPRNKSEEFTDFLKNHSIFAVLDKTIIEGLCPLISEIECGPGHIVFQEGDPADAMYIIKRGAVAVIQSQPQQKVLAYLTAGECFGEMAVIHDQPRSATIRVPEEATILRLPSAALKELTKKFPAMTTELADIINRRTSGENPFKPPGLQGNLAFFDLPTVIQTVLGSRRNGLLVLFGRSGKVVGQVAVRDSVIVRSTYQHRKGVAALFELMNNADPLDFTFDDQVVTPDEIDADLAKRQPYMLLIEGARRADELPRLLKGAGWPSSIYEPLVGVPDLKLLGEDRKDASRKIWSLIEVGTSFEGMVKQLPFDRYTVASILNEMINHGFLRLTPGKRITDEYIKRTMQLSKPKLSQLPPPEEWGRQAEIDLYEDEVTESPFEVVKLVNAVNGICTNLGIIFGKIEIRMLLQEALAKTVRTFPNLSSIKVYMDSPALDLRGATAEFSQSSQTVPALVHLAMTVVDLSSKMVKQANRV